MSFKQCIHVVCVRRKIMHGCLVGDVKDSDSVAARLFCVFMRSHLIRLASGVFV